MSEANVIQELCSSPDHELSFADAISEVLYIEFSDNLRYFSDLSHLVSPNILHAWSSHWAITISHSYHPVTTYSSPSKTCSGSTWRGCFCFRWLGCPTQRFRSATVFRDGFFFHSHEVLARLEDLYSIRNGDKSSLQSKQPRSCWPSFVSVVPHHCIREFAFIISVQVVIQTIWSSTPNSLLMLSQCPPSSDWYLHPWGRMSHCLSHLIFTVGFDLLQ